MGGRKVRIYTVRATPRRTQSSWGVVLTASDGRTRRSPVYDFKMAVFSLKSAIYRTLVRQDSPAVSRMPPWDGSKMAELLMKSAINRSDP